MNPKEIKKGSIFLYSRRHSKQLYWPIGVFTSLGVAIFKVSLWSRAPNLWKRQQFTKMISLSSSSFSLYKSNGKSEKNVTRCDNNVVNIYLFKLNNRNTRKRCEICPKSTIETLEQRSSRYFIASFEHISHVFLVPLLWTLGK